MRKNGVKPVALLGVVLRLQMTEGSSVSHLRLNLLILLKILGFSPWRIMPLARSTCSFVCGCATADQSTHMWKLSQNAKNFLPLNWVPLSVMIEFGTPNLKTMSLKNRAACSDLKLPMGRASIHLENLSTATSKWVKPLGAFFSGPTRSSPHTANGQVMGMVCRAWPGGVFFERRTGNLRMSARRRWRRRPRWASKNLAETRCPRGCVARRDGRRCQHGCRGLAPCPP